ncbi:MAG: helix-turn-helix transcriptional regulator [Paludibacteraceae bacterium]|nr:helix-turn-helix transcriptional regulator [Paludibacteraceae bacterium]
MNTYISASEYLGILVQGGNIFYFLVNAVFLFFVMPKLQQRRNQATVAIHNSLGYLLFIYLVNYSLWIVPELLQPMCGYYQIGRVYPSYNIFMEYMDLAILPLSMAFGSAVLLGKMPKKWLGPTIPLPYTVCALSDIYDLLPFKLYQPTYLSTLVLNAAQLAWYGFFIKKFDKKLLENCSNIDRRSTKWVFWTLVPLFLLTILYIPFNILSDNNEWMILYDFLTFLFLSGIVGCALTHKVDDITIDLIEEQIEDLKPEEDKEGNRENTAIETNKAAEPAVQPTRADSREAVTDPSTTDSNAPSTENKQATATNRFADFDKIFEKLEADQFYLDSEVNIDWISSKVGTNRHYVSDYLNQVKRVTFYEYVNTLRLTHAERLLKEGKEKVTDIAFISGFNSDHTFRRLFKEKYGCTPLQYQRGCLK